MDFVFSAFKGNIYNFIFITVFFYTKEGWLLRPECLSLIFNWLSLISLYCRSALPFHEQQIISIKNKIIFSLQLIEDVVFSYRITDSFTFAKAVENLVIDPNISMSSFDVYSLFTKITLDETIKICLETLYDKSDLQPVIPKDLIAELIKGATFSV